MDFDPPQPPFLGAIATEAPAVVIIGAPLDLTESFRSGTAAAPRRIRAVSDVLETYSPVADADLTELPLTDWGDLRLTGLSMEAALDAVAQAMGKALHLGLPIMLGGEHTATIGAVRAVYAAHSDLVILQVDAHTDLRDEYDGVKLSHATVMRRIADVIGIERIIQCGIRSGTREEFQLARQCLSSSSELRLNEAASAAVRRAPVYLTIDIDALDASCAPGTGCPEPGGASFAELERFIASLAECHVVGVDVMEVLPAVDSNDITSMAAAKLVRETALAFGRPGRR
jgi:agmatinase